MKISYKKIRQLLNYYGKKDILIIDTPEHGNLGDQAIALAELQFIKEVLPSFNIAERTAMEIDGFENLYAKLTDKNTLIIVHGGGFIGSLWPNEEYRFRRIIQAFKKNKIIVLPQTVTFDFSSKQGLAFFDESRRIYYQHSDITFFVRESKSLKFMNSYLPNIKTVLVPDIVLYLDVLFEEYKRKDILLCMRKDVERIIDDVSIKKIIDYLGGTYPEEKIIFTDTVVSHNINCENRISEVMNKLTQFAKAKIVVTDRLHGMIFAAITNTPCIALGNSNGKVEGVYEWLKGNKYIKFAKSINELAIILKELNLDRKYIFDKSIYRKFCLLSNELLNNIKLIKKIKHT